MDNNNFENNLPNNQISNSTITSPKKSKSGFNGKTVIAICLICCLLTSTLSIGLSNLILFDDDIQSSSPNSDKNTLSSQGEYDILSSSKDKNPPNKDNTDTTINVETVSSPATAVAKKVSPSIVGIRVTTTTNYGPYGNYESSGDGSGVIYTDDGYIITNYHVIANTLTSSGEQNPNSTLTVYLNQDMEKGISGSVIGYDKSADLAVVKIDKNGLTEIEIGDSQTLNVGDIAIAIGNPGGLDFMGSITQGIISGLNRSIQTEDSYEDLTLIQTDAAINPGNSGGALCNIKGELIGINSVKLVETGYESMGFAIPSKDVVKICDDIIRNGTTQVVYLGLEFSEKYTTDILTAQGYPEGIVVSSVADNSPASSAGFEIDDILVSFNGADIKSIEDLTKAKKECSSGDTVYAKIYRLTLQRYGFISKWVGEYMDLSITFE